MQWLQIWRVSWPLILLDLRELLLRGGKGRERRRKGSGKGKGRGSEGRGGGVKERGGEGKGKGRERKGEGKGSEVGGHPGFFTWIDAFDAVTSNL